MAVHLDKFVVNKTNRCTEFQFYWYYDSTCFGQPFCPSSGVLSLHRHWYILCSFDNRLLPVLMAVCYQEDWTAVPTCSWYQCRCTAENSWWWAERLPETCRVVIPIKLECSASVGFIHKEFVTMRGHTILQFSSYTYNSLDIMANTMWKSSWFKFVDMS